MTLQTPVSIAGLCKRTGNHLKVCTGHWSLRDVKLDNGLPDLCDVWAQTSHNTALTPNIVSGVVYLVQGGDLRGPPDLLHQPSSGVAIAPAAPILDVVLLPG